MRVLTPTRSIENLENFSKLSDKSRCNSHIELRKGSGGLMKNSPFPYMFNNGTTIDSASHVTEKSVRLSAHMPCTVMRNAYDNYEIQQELKKH